MGSGFFDLKLLLEVRNLGLQFVGEARDCKTVSGDVVSGALGFLKLSDFQSQFLVLRLVAVKLIREHKLLVLRGSFERVKVNLEVLERATFSTVVDEGVVLIIHARHLEW